MLVKILQKKLIPKLAKAIKPGLIGLIEKAEDYRNSIELKPGEVTVMALVFLDKDKCYIAPCAMRMSDNGKLGVSRKLQQYNLEDLADLLIKNMDKVDLSTLLTDTDNE